MNVDELKLLLEGTRATVKPTTVDGGQDPYVLYSRKYGLKQKLFTSVRQLREFFTDKKLVVRSCPDEDDGWVVEYWMHSDKVVESEIEI